MDRLYARIGRPGWTWLGLSVATLAVAQVLAGLGRPLVTKSTPRGILDLEFAATDGHVQKVLEAWGRVGIDAAVLQTRVDFLFLLLYPLALSLACWLVARALPQGGLARIGCWVSAAVLLAAPLDAIENVLILAMLDGQFASWTPVWTFRFASLKFVLALGGAPAFLGIGGLAWLRLRSVPSMSLNQVTLPATDLARSVDFYQTLGLVLIVDSLPRYARFECPDGGSTLSLHSVESVPDETGFTIYFEIADLDRRVEELREAGLDLDDPVDQRWLWRETRIKDPDGNVICLYSAGKNRRFPPWRVDNSGNREEAR